MEFSIELSPKKAAVLGALLLGLAFVGIAVGLASNNTPWHSVQEISTDANGTTSIDADADGVVDFSNKAYEPQSLECQIITTASPPSPPVASCPSGWMLTGIGGSCGGGGNTKIVPSITNYAYPTFPLSGKLTPYGATYDPPQKEVQVDCGGSNEIAYAVCCRVVSICLTGSVPHYCP